ncbi:hypothetical protein AXF42_Ash018140 [Apostasia shenzhenica]|uniref:Uncharacterized protein n=1 Tax=Apostasia shenzhenica TaxID=1088818 RepID=A0A2I0AF04_9ASPA|nr:hypothetical protein AXF42_Ash018140 [Apostasia shenzhenica]
MASVGNVRLSYRPGAAGLLLLLLLLIIISGSVEGIQPITTHRLTAPRQVLEACLAAILAHNFGELLKEGQSVLLKLKEALDASYEIKPDGTAHYRVQFFAEAFFFQQNVRSPLLSMLTQVTAAYTLRAAGLDPLGNVDGKTLTVEIDYNYELNF